MRPSLFLASVFLLSFTLQLASSDDLLRPHKCHPHDKHALLKIKKDFGNPYTLASWNPKTDCCKWYSVKCDLKTRRVTRLFAFSGGLSGPIPASIGNLPLLEMLVLKKQPELTGHIQPAIGKLKNLKVLLISGTNVSGPVPEFISHLNKLSFLELSFNHLSGSIPSSLSKLPHLKELDLRRNKLKGSIPGTFGGFKTKDFSLRLSHNQLSGKIPSSLGNGDFNTIDISWNKLEGDASMLFNAKRKREGDASMLFNAKRKLEGDASMLLDAKRKSTLWRVDLSRNQLAFSLNHVKLLPKSLKYLDLSHNKITGGIPQGWKFTLLDGLNVSHNGLCGPIPVGGTLQKFDASSYGHNKCLCGPPLPIKCKC